ncbi:hypothetical protein Syun_013522 [Stephania yunnanensis]|uniref:Protein odr-4 homolog n=1 Tax=Stephania yunnanensis TaxID=152371 RepID=A0AAP0JJT5_9MAGN
MVRAVVGEEHQLQSAEDRLFKSNVSAQIGLVIGKISPALDRAFVFDLITAPPNDAAQPPCSLLETPAKDDKRRGSKPRSQSQIDSSSLDIDCDWVAEHARQVSRMLLGGMNVVGIFIWASESAFKNSSLKIWQTVNRVAEAAPVFDCDVKERLIIHISYSPRRWTCRNCLLGSSFNSTSLRPCDFKMGKVLASLQTFKCTYNFEMRLPIFCETASQGNTLKDVLHNGISQHAMELKGARAIIDGHLELEEQTYSPNGIHKVEMLLPFAKDLITEACGGKEIVGAVVFSGSICSFSYLSPKESVSQAIEDIKGDIIMSLRSRLDIICDEADADIGSTVEGETAASSEIFSDKSLPQAVLHLLRKPCGLVFPRRVLIPWLADSFICDYLQPSETFEVLKDHFRELLSIETLADTSKILEPEVESSIKITKSFWDATASSQPSSKPVDQSRPRSDYDSKQSAKPTTSYASTAIAVLLLALLVGLVIFILDKRSSVA